MIFEKKLVKEILLLVSAFAVVARVALEGISALAKTSGKTIVKKTRPSQQASVACGWAGAVMGGRGSGGCCMHESISLLQLGRSGDAKTAHGVQV